MIVVTSSDILAVLMQVHHFLVLRYCTGNIVQLNNCVPQNQAVLILIDNHTERTHFDVDSVKAIIATKAPLLKKV